MGPQTQVSLDYVFKLIGIFLTVVVFLTGIIIAAFKMFHNDLKKSIQDLHNDLRPLILDVNTLKSEMLNLREDHKELKDFVHEQAKWVGQHSTDIQAINRTLKQQ